MAKTLDQLAVKFLLDDRQKELKVLARAQRILIGVLCPYCEGRELVTNRVTNAHDLEAICEAGCNDGEPFGTFDAAAKELARIGVDLQ